MAAQIAGIFDENLRANINKSKVLVVGAGGIGCEILKNLVLCGFQDIEIVSVANIFSNSITIQLNNNLHVRFPICTDRFGHNRCQQPESPVPLPQGARWQIEGRSCT